MTRDLPPSTWKAQPWKNGGGVTYEIVRWPADADDFDLRVSVADVERDGPFSTFPGYSRHSILLGSAPLEFANGERAPMTMVGDGRTFDGATPISVRLPSGPTRLLNILVRKSGPMVRTGTTIPSHPVRFVFDLATQHACVFDPPQPILVHACTFDPPQWEYARPIGNGFIFDEPKLVVWIE